VRPRRFHIFKILVAASLASGCANMEHDIGAPLPIDAMKDFAAGSYYGEVLDRFGPPTKMSALTVGMVFQYERVKLRERQYGLILPGEIGKWIKAVYASADADVEVMQFIFGEDGKLRSADAEVWSTDAGAGFSVTLIFSTGSFTDTKQYERAASRPLEWGSALTTPLLKTLNAAQNLEIGANGVQLPATAQIVGQHTLELEN